MLDKPEVQTGVAVVALGGLLTFLAKKSYSAVVGKWRAGKVWIDSVDAMKAELAGLTGPKGIQAFLTAVNDKIDAATDTLTHAIGTISDKVGILHAMRVIDLDRLEEPVVTFCRELKLSFANKSAMRVFGVNSMDELRGHAWKDKIDFNTIERAELAMQKAAAEFRPCTVNVTLRNTQTDGKPIQLCLEPIISPEHHEFSGFTGIAVDLEQRHLKAIRKEMTPV